MTQHVPVSAALDIATEVRAITAALKARSDPAYEAGMRRTVPSAQPAHATRVPDVRRTASKWRAAHRDAGAEDVLALCDALWDTGWREERLTAIYLGGGSKSSRGLIDWERVERWSAAIDNWELVDNLADLTGRMLVSDKSLLRRVTELAKRDHPWQRRLALVTLIVAFRKDGTYRSELSQMAEVLSSDPHPLVRRAVVWARDRLRKDDADA